VDVPIRANGQLSLGAYQLDAAGSGHAHAIQVLAVDTNARISTSPPSTMPGPIGVRLLGDEVSERT
jgi:hypothetical protein